MRTTTRLAALLLAASTTSLWAQAESGETEDDAAAAEAGAEDDDGAPAAGAAMPGGRTLTLGFAGLMDNANRTDLEPINLSAGVMESAGPYQLQSGGYYRIDITSDGTQEIAVEGPDFFRNVWVNEIVINDLEVRPLGVDSIEFDDEGTVHMSFVAITPGQYQLRIRGTTGETQQATFVIQ
jgi:hypothetical protein